MIAPNQEVVWRPHPGPQTEALAATEFELLYGGAKGGGKTDYLLIDPLRQVHIPAFKALILRETYSELEELLRRARSIYMRLPSKPVWNAEQKAWLFPNPDTKTGAGGAIIKFGYCQYLKDVERYQGQEWGQICYDELGNQADERVWSDLLKEIRSPDPRVLRKARASANPGYAGHAWIKRRFVALCGKDGERVHTFELKVPGPDGEELVLRQTRRYIPAKITDNPVYARDVAYLATLHALPEQRRNQLLHGDWDAGLGLALPELAREVHMIEPFEIPDHWRIVGGFDWGYAHRWAMPFAAITEDGWIIVTDTAWGWRQLPRAICDRARAIHGPLADRVSYIATGHDAWAIHKARRQEGDERTPSIAERMMEQGFPLTKANQDRIMGLNNLREYTAWRGRAPDGSDDDPALLFFDTPGNRRLFDQCEGMVTDPDNPEEPLKMDADPETGEGGDDGFDALRYLAASRPPRAPSIALDQEIHAWDPEMLAHEMREGRTVRNPDVKRDTKIDPMVLESVD